MSETHITTHVEDINMVRQLIALVKQRPCIGGHGISRACAIGYAELTVMERSLKSALDKMDLAVKALTNAQLPKSGIHADDERPLVGFSPTEAKVIQRLRERTMTASQLASELNMNPNVMLEEILLVLQGLGVVEADCTEGLEETSTEWRVI